MGLSRLQNIVTDDKSAQLIVDNQAAIIIVPNARVTLDMLICVREEVEAGVTA
ncbi:hypothetical protein [Shewanella livingstonensis]|uniref:hypothetical protein n=1 Tax=Shewanella livingstonensis TaxID=150120 RepID=UPI0013E35081|nr:hypothetical protein [Shewanella livingstonensis]